MKTFTSRLLDLLQRYEDALAEGAPLDPAELCAAEPDLLPAFEEAVAQLDGFRRRYPVGDSTEPNTSGPPDPGRGLPVLPGYIVEGVLGEGGMGVVYRAVQVRGRRPVAIKMLRTAVPGDSALRRFQTEAEAVARLNHPNIVQIFEIGEADGLPFFSMEFCAGGSLAQRLAREPLPPHEAAMLLRVLAGALQAAHTAQVVHRDLKPANVLLSADGTPKISDFGLAKKLDEAGQTHTGEVMGTPSYMAPEQARGDREVGPAADVYALGAILYACLTGRPPFRAATPMDTLWQVIHAEPAAVRQLNPAVPVDLETICHKCLHKDPARRYGSARELGDDLTRYLEGRPIQARPVGAVERAWRWCQRNPAVAGLALAVVLTLAAGTAIATYYGFEAGREADNARTQANRAEHEMHKAQDKERLAEQKTAEAMAAAHRTGLARLAIQVEQGLRFAQERNLLRAEGILADIDPAFRDLWEVRFLRDLCRRVGLSFGTDQVCLALSPDGRLLASGSGAGTVTLWDAATGAALRETQGHTNRVGGVAFTPDGKTVLSASWDGTVQFQDVATGEVLRALHEDDAQFYCLAISPDGGLLATGDFAGVVRLWDLAAGTEKHICRGHTGHVHGLAFTSDGHTLVSGSQDGSVRTWDAATGRERAVVHRNPVVGVLQVAVSPSWIAAGDQDGAILLYPHAGGPPRVLQGHTRHIVGLAFSADEGTLASASLDSHIRLWDPRTGAELATLRGHPHEARSLVFADDQRSGAPGRYLASVGGNLRWWHLDAQPERFTLPAHASEVVALALAPDNRTLASAGRDGTVRIWDALTGRQQLGLEAVHGWGEAAVPGDGATLISESGWPVSVLRWWDPAGRRILAEFARSPRRLETLALSRDNRTLVGCEDDGTFRVWDTATAEQVATLPSPTGRRFYTSALSADGRRLAGGGFQGELVLWDVPSGRVLHVLQARRRDAIRPLVLSPDGKILAGAGDGDTLRIWDTSTGQPRAVCSGHRTTLTAAAFAPDGGTIATGDHAGVVKVWEASTGRERRSWQAHAGRIEALAFAPDGTLLASSVGGDAGAIRLWDTATGARRADLKGHLSPARVLGFSADGRSLTSACQEVIRSWVRDSASVWTERVLARRLSQISGLAFGPEGKHLMAQTGAASGEVIVWEVASGHEVRSFETATRGVHAAFGPRGRIVALTHNEGLTQLSGPFAVQLRESATGRLLASLPAGTSVVSRCAFSPDGGTLAGVGGAALTVWDVAAGGVRFRVAARNGGYNRCAFAPDGRTLATNLPADADRGPILLWDASTGREQGRLKGHVHPLAALAAGPEPGTLLSASGELASPGEIKLWDLPTGQERLLLAAPANPTCLAVSPDGTTLVVGGSDGSLRVWRSPPP